MRWLFIDTADQAQSARKQAVLARIDHWWQAFQAKTGEIDALFHQQSKWDLAGWMGHTLQAVAENLCWEYGPAVEGPGHRLVITPESQRQLRPLTATIIDRAPQIEGWEFYPYRLPESVEMAQQMVEVRTGGKIDDVVVEARIGEHHLIDLVFRSPRTNGDTETQALNDAIVATETILGEQLLDQWVGVIDVASLRSSDETPEASGGEKPREARSIPLERLKSTVDALIGSVQDQLPAEPHFRHDKEGTEWSAIRLRPEPADDYVGRRDLMVAITPNQPLWMAAHSSRPFYSPRFSRCGETFAYAKIDGTEGLEGSAFGDRAEIEDALDAALSEQGLGGAIGGGTGLRYSYVDLALTDLRRGVEVARSVLREGRVSERSWILFFDTDYCGEWIGVYATSPPPPVSSDDESSA